METKREMEMEMELGKKMLRVYTPLPLRHLAKGLCIKCQMCHYLCYNFKYGTLPPDCNAFKYGIIQAFIINLFCI